MLLYFIPAQTNGRKEAFLPLGDSVMSMETQNLQSTLLVGVDVSFANIENRLQMLVMNARLDDLPSPPTPAAI